MQRAPRTIQNGEMRGESPQKDRETPKGTNGFSKAHVSTSSADRRILG